MRALDEGNGAIIALPHLGGWEWAGRWIADRGHPITVVVERIEPPELFEWFVDLRSKLGMTVVPLGPDSATTVMKALRDNHIVCLVSDRDLMGGGPQVDFFGERTTLPGGAATLALRTGSPIIPTGVYFTNRVDGHYAWVKPPIVVARESKRLRDDVDRVTQLVAYELETLIRRAPFQWHLFQPNWPIDPGTSITPGRDVTTAADARPRAFVTQAAFNMSAPDADDMASTTYFRIRCRVALARSSCWLAPWRWSTSCCPRARVPKRSE